MRTVVWLVLLFSAAVVAASFLGGNDGLVSFYWQGWRADVSLNLFVLALGVLCLALLALIHSLNALLGLPRRAREWRTRRRDQGVQTALREALMFFFAARYSRAYKAARRALSIQMGTPALRADAELEALARLVSASSLHRLQDRTPRDAELRSVLDLAAGSGRARVAAEGAGLLGAEWALDDRDAAGALTRLMRLPAGAARRTQALRLRLQALRLDRQPLEALRTAKMLAKHQGLSKVAAEGLIRALAIEALDGARDAGQLRRVWSQLDAPERRDAFVVARAAARAGACGIAGEGREWLRPAWDAMHERSVEERASIALALIDVVDGIGADWLGAVEEVLANHARESEVVCAAGVAFAEHGLWGKARALLEQAASSTELRSDARRIAWLRLARLAEHEGDGARAADCYRDAALLV